MQKFFLGAVLLLLLSSCNQTGAPASPITDVPRKRDSAADPEVAQGGIAPLGPGSLPRATTAREVTAILRKRVEAGDSQAACQLARELAFCAGAEAQGQRLGQFAERVRETPVEEVNERNRNDVLETLADLAKVRGEYCAGMPTATQAESVNLWRKAALRGHLPSMLQYGAGLAFSQDHLLETLDELKVYKRDGVEMVKQVASGGNFSANLMLARAYAPQNTGPNLTPLLRQSVPHDAAQALAYYLLAQELQRTASSTRITPVQLQTEANGLRMMMTADDVSEGERRFGELQRALRPTSGADFDPIAQGERDSNQPVPGTEICERDEFVIAQGGR